LLYLADTDPSGSALALQPRRQRTTANRVETILITRYAADEEVSWAGGQQWVLNKSPAIALSALPRVTRPSPNFKILKNL
jgi:hypothetical protein